MNLGYVRDRRDQRRGARVLPTDIGKLNRYLNAMRSTMLFAPRVMHVEGIAAALVLPPTAATLFPPGSIERSRFVGTALVPIDGVDIIPYLRLLHVQSERRLCRDRWFCRGTTSHVQNVQFWTPRPTRSALIADENVLSHIAET